MYILPMPITYHRGPLDLSVRRGPGVRFCAPDNDIPWHFSGLPFRPRLQPIGPCETLYYLEGHRAQDHVLAVLEALDCTVIVQGDPLAFRPQSCNLIASKLMVLPSPSWFAPSMDYYATISECLDNAVGDWRIFASDRDSAKAVCRHLRGHEHNVVAGDCVYDWKNKRRARVVHPEKVRLSSGGRTLVKLDDGRIVHSGDLNSYLVDTAHTMGSGECDTLIILPDVCDHFGCIAVRRVKHLILGVGWHPKMYCTT